MSDSKGPCGPCSEIFWDQQTEIDGERYDIIAIYGNMLLRVNTQVLRDLELGVYAV
jgi:alanyl-tRNA synthetase